MWQNARCSSVFRIKIGDEFVCYDIDADESIPLDDNGLQRISFPYDPLTSMVQPPNYEVVVREASNGSGA